MMKVRVNTYLNLRTGEPRVLPNNNPNNFYYSPGDVLEITDTLFGDSYQDNNVWYKLSDGGYVWSGGVSDERIGWGLRVLGVPKVWNKTRGKGIKIAILDTGIDLANDDLKTAVVAKYNVLNNNDEVEDTDGHGTYCASIAASRGNGKMIGVAPECSLIIIKISNDSSSFDSKNLIKGINWANQSGANIISLSMGNSDEESELTNLIRNSISKGKIFVAAAGGHSSTDVLYPANLAGMISVNACSIDNRQLNYNEGTFTLGFYYAHGNKNETNEGITITAPGDYIDAYGLGNNIKSIAGTSFATPFVAGIIAMLLTVKPNLTHDEIRKLVIDASIQRVKSYSQEYWGAGVIDPVKLIL